MQYTSAGARANKRKAGEDEASLDLELATYSCCTTKERVCVNYLVWIVEQSEPSNSRPSPMIARIAILADGSANVAEFCRSEATHKQECVHRLDANQQDMRGTKWEVRVGSSLVRACSEV